ncbi:uncharacterized protein LOC109860053 [Pseudomyrmex gracilis]|uniref:uncharacterized protein LOC109860053 n=1 Tax=Pseudomyrmex gracilis TaxID=219809 RepID=UPI00099536BE|nr:uncharacterized protein LOC109860053 [Pseudomyrmex gracilis]XP_020294490.1 uncharacterized protein LOC109860053 [Pseudomyrmex gracilis]
MVSQFRLESMHLVYEGMFKRFLEAQISWDGPLKLNAATMRQISAILLEMKLTCPVDFNRKPQVLEKWHKYKATEFRRLLLYDGMVVFKNNLHPSIYLQFLLLQCAIYILASKYLLSIFCDEAEVFLDRLVDHCVEVFGEHFVSYNVHSLKHLANECRSHGPLDSFSAFPYENFLKDIKNTLRSGYQPLHQLAKRDSERIEKKEVVMENQDNTVELFHAHYDPFEKVLGEQYKKICINKVVLKIGQKDSCFMTNKGVVVVLENIVQRDKNSIVLTGKKFNNQDDFYTFPLKSSCLGIFKVWNKNDLRENFQVENIFAKCWLMRHDNIFVAVPLVHTTPLLH